MGPSFGSSGFVDLGLVLFRRIVENEGVIWEYISINIKCNYDCRDNATGMVALKWQS
jgi:hypothetical protein